MRYGYDEQGRLTSVGRSQDPVAYASYEYGNGSVTEKLLNGAVTRVYTMNALGDLQSIADDFFKETLFFDTRASGQPGYLNGQIASAKYEFTWDKAPAGYIYEYYYDAFGRLTRADNSANAAWTVGTPTTLVEYDNNGNIQSMNRGGTPITFSYVKGTNRLSDSGPGQGFTYDAKGNVTGSTRLGLSITYDPLWNQVTTAGKRRDLRGQRIYVRDPQGRVLIEKSDTGSVRYVYGLRGRVAMIDASGATYALLTDHNLSPRVVVTADRQVVAWYNFDPFGQMLEEISNPGSIGLRYLYTGQEWDEDLGLYNFVARFYDPVVCRFYSPDPDRQFASPYIYSDNPVSFDDPTGDFFWLALLAIGIGAVVGGGLEAAREAAAGEELSAGKIAAGAVVGGVAGGLALWTGGGSLVEAGKIMGLGMLKGAATGASVSAVTALASGADAEGVGRAAGYGAISGAQGGLISAPVSKAVTAGLTMRTTGQTFAQALQTNLNVATTTSKHLAIAAAAGGITSAISTVPRLALEGASPADWAKGLAISFGTGAASGGGLALLGRGGRSGRAIFAIARRAARSAGYRAAAADLMKIERGGNVTLGTIIGVTGLGRRRAPPPRGPEVPTHQFLHASPSRRFRFGSALRTKRDGRDEPGQARPSRLDHGLRAISSRTASRTPVAADEIQELGRRHGIRVVAGRSVLAGWWGRARRRAGRRQACARSQRACRSARRVRASRRDGARQRLGDRGQVREIRQSVVGADGGRPDRTGLQRAGKWRIGVDDHRHAAGEDIVERRRRPAQIWNDEQLDAGALLQTFAGQVRERSAPGRRIGKLARLAFGERDELRQGLDAERRDDRQHERLRRHKTDRNEVTRQLERQIRLLARQCHEGRRRGHIERVAVRRGLCSGARRDGAAGARMVEHDDLAAPHLRQPIAHETQQRIRRSARRGVGDDADRLVGIVLRVRGEMRGDQRDGAGGKTEERTARQHKLMRAYQIAGPDQLDSASCSADGERLVISRCLWPDQALGSVSRWAEFSAVAHGACRGDWSSALKSGCSGGAKRKLTGTNCGCARCAFMARRLRNCLISVASMPPIIASSPNVISQSPVLCDCACVSGATFGRISAGCGAAAAAGSKSSEIELIKAAASTGVAARSPGGSSGCSASAASLGDGVTSAGGWGSGLGSLLATGAGSA